MSRSRILLCDDEVNIRKVLGTLLKQAGYEVHAEEDGKAALARVRAYPSGTFDAVITDIRMPNMDGMQLLHALIQEDPQLPVIMLTAHGSVDTAVEALKAGAFDFLEKPFEIEQIKTVLGKAIATRERTGASVGTGKTSAAEPGAASDPSQEVGMIGDSPQMQKVREIVRTAAASPTTVLIAGESGTGKELVARALHVGSPRREAPFIRVNCAAIPAGLTESELFGHERGAFTGAVSSRQGRFELADGGTLFLDEVSEIPLEIQVKLLRAIQESEFERVGGTKTVHVDVRLIAASNRNLEAEIKAGRFREDLFYRLNVVPIELPALRERIGDLPALIEHFVSRCNQRLDKKVSGFSSAALEALSRYAWPGNIRELENLVERMVLFASGPVIERDALPETFLETPSSADREADGDEPNDEPDDEDADEIVGGEPVIEGAEGSVPGPEGERLLRLPLSSLGLDLKEAVKQGSRLVETELISAALEQTQGNVTRSARLLGISRRSLQSKMKELGLRTPAEDSTTKGIPPV
ncbi:sigma-54-dependent transcriptional regulator [Paraliomyxa miuraensis]|uniref:sigma-54-dependent transcriptional regulator n=1 Tax=Paraliomyxa miuraensis TaxID=376150 RepID=UPI002254C62F|nr:sigma-54 dependent transcriptional regulator [Paraliomyxa miuraensis]MCX4240309.1 sigma-54 dependent transcriptional regulator [Paraliomyxa miuraensis]